MPEPEVVPEEPAEVEAKADGDKSPSDANKSNKSDAESSLKDVRRSLVENVQMSEADRIKMIKKYLKQKEPNLNNEDREKRI